MSTTPAEPEAWVTTDDVKDFMGDDAPAVSEGLELALDAAKAYVEDDCPHLTAPYGATVKLGAAMLAARWYARRGSLLGTAGYNDFGTATIMRDDPDIARMLKIGRHTPFGFGAPPLPPEEPEVVPGG